MALRAGPILIASSAKICRAEDLARLRRALLIEQRLGFDLAGRAAGAGTRAKHHDLPRRATRRPAAWRHSVHSTHQSIYLALFAPRTTGSGRKGMKMSVNMRIVSIICCIALFTVNALSLFTGSSPFHSYFAGASLVVA